MTEATPKRAVIYARQSMGKSKSITDQIAECVADVEAQGWALAGTEQDGISASRFASKAREAWPRVVADIEAGEMNALVLWESSRGDRDAEAWLGLLRRCREHKVLIRVTSHNRTYDIRNARDWRTLAEDGVDNAYESERLSGRIRRGAKTSAESGRPPVGRAPYGFRRVYNQRTGELVGQEPDPDALEIVVEIFDKISRSVPLSEIRDDLNERGIPAPLGGTWRRQRLRDIGLNVAYVGLRKHERDGVTNTYPAEWGAVVDENVFYAARRVLTDPVRQARFGRPVGVTRPGKQVHLLTYLGICDVCEAGLHARATYYCCNAGHASARRSAVDDYVTEAVLGRLGQPDIYARLRKAGASADKRALTAREQVKKLSSDLNGWRLSAARGKTTEASLAIIEADLSAQIREAQRKADQADLPPALRFFLEPGADLRQRWAASPVTARRDVIRALAVVRLKPAKQNSFIPVHERLEHSRWLKDRLTWGQIWSRDLKKG